MTTTPLPLNETLQLLALQISANPDDLIRFAAEDTIGGWDMGKGGWPMGSLWSVEGKALYALTRALHPAVVAEIGSWRGCSAAHIATALQVNGKGKLTCVDIKAGSGDMLPGELGKRVQSVVSDGVEWLRAQADGSIDLLFEDGDHSSEMCAAVAALAQVKLKPGGILVVHDAGHDFAYVGGGERIDSDVGEAVRHGLRVALGDHFRVYLSQPSDCGFAVYQRPNTGKFAPKQGTMPAEDGYTYETPIKGEPQAIEKPTTPKLETMTVQALKDFAKAHNIPLEGARTHAAIIAKIGEHMAANA